MFTSLFWPVYFCKIIEDIFVSSYANDECFVIVLYVFVLQFILSRKYFFYQCTWHKYGFIDSQFTFINASVICCL